jgi:hypothetical protein
MRCQGLAESVEAVAMAHRGSGTEDIATLGDISPWDEVAKARAQYL